MQRYLSLYVKPRLWQSDCVVWDEAREASRRTTYMLWTIFVILIVMWLLGMATSYTLGGFIHILLLLAIASVLIRVIQGRNPI